MTKNDLITLSYGWLLLTHDMLHSGEQLPPSFLADSVNFVEQLIALRCHVVGDTRYRLELGRVCLHLLGLAMSSDAVESGLDDWRFVDPLVQVMSKIRSARVLAAFLAKEAN